MIRQNLQLLRPRIVKHSTRTCTERKEPRFYSCCLGCVIPVLFSPYRHMYSGRVHAGSILDTKKKHEPASLNSQSVVRAVCGV